MSERKGWGSLSPEYRRRLEKGGITQDAYESGVSIRKARGHQHTPERPLGYDVIQFPQYNRERKRLIQELIDKKEELFGERPRYHAIRAANIVRQTPMSMANLRWAVNDATEDDLIDAIRSDPETFKFIGYK